MDLHRYKDLFLKSGIPLEVSVVQKLSKLGLMDNGEVIYERGNKLFSTDISSMKEFKLIDQFGVAINFVLECKYKTEDHKWFFMLFPSTKHGSNDRFDCRNAVFDMLLYPLLHKAGYRFKEYESSLADFRVLNLFDCPIVNKGVDIFKKGFIPDIIKEASSQSTFGSIKFHKESMEYNFELFEDLFYGNIENEFDLNAVASVTFPIIVTTAPLYRVKEEISLEDIEKEKDFTNICEEVKGVLLTNEGNESESTFTRQLFDKKPIINKRTIEYLDKVNLMENTSESIKWINPGFIYIINYKYTEELFSIALNKIKKICEEFSKKIKNKNVSNRNI